MVLCIRSTFHNRYICWLSSFGNFASFLSFHYFGQSFTSFFRSLQSMGHSHTAICIVCDSWHSNHHCFTSRTTRSVIIRSICFQQIFLSHIQIPWSTVSCNRCQLFFHLWQWNHDRRVDRLIHPWPQLPRNSFHFTHQLHVPSVRFTHSMYCCSFDNSIWCHS